MKQTRQRKKGKLYNRKAMAILFIGFLMLFCLVNVLVRDREFSEKENRMLEQKPKLSWTGIESGRCMNPISRTSLPEGTSGWHLRRGWI